MSTLEKRLQKAGKYGPQDITRALDMPGGQFQNWLNRGIVKLGKTVKHGGRTYRRFDADDARQLAVIAAFTKSGMDVSVAAGIAEQIFRAEFTEDFIVPVGPSPGLVVMRDGSATLEEVAKHASPAPMFFCIDRRKINELFPD